MISLRMVLYVLAGAVAAVLLYDWWRSANEGLGDISQSPIMELGDAFRELHTEHEDGERDD